MATQTRHIARRSTTFFRATGKAYMIAACFGLVLLSAVAAHAAAMNELPLNGMPMNGVQMNRIHFNGYPMDELFLHGAAAHGASYSSKPSISMQSETLPWASLSQKALGKTSH